MIPTVALATALAFATPPAQNCSHDAFTIDGRPVSVEICASDATVARGSRDLRRGTLAVIETLVSRDLSFSRQASLDVLLGTDVSRTIDDIPLDKVGIGKTLHVTIGYKPGQLRLEHALLVPGAVALK